MLAVGLGAMLLVACAARRDRSATPEGPVTEMEAQRRIKEAIRRSSEGVILLPSRKSERLYELPRLNEIAQDLRQPFAACFLRRAIATMKPRADGKSFDGVPEGQAKIRTRIAPSGEVVRAEVLQTGFSDPDVEACLTETLERQRWPENQTGNVHFVDVVYWVSLGAQRDRDTPQFEQLVRRESIAAGVRAKPCLQGRVDAGTYVVEALNLVDREGGTLTNRVDQDTLPEPIRACIARAFRDIRLARDPDSFVRPIAPHVEFVVQRDGTIAIAGEDWLSLLEREEAARVAQKRAELDGDGTTVRPELVDLGPDAVEDDLVPEPIVETREEPVAAPRVDPGQGGLRLPLGKRRAGTGTGHGAGTGTGTGTGTEPSSEDAARLH